jgi:hypothetical protein
LHVGVADTGKFVGDTSDEVQHHLLASFERGRFGMCRALQTSSSLASNSAAAGDLSTR